MGRRQRLWTAVKALGYLGPVRMVEYGMYRLGLQFNAFNIPQSAQDEQAYPLNLDLIPPLPAAQASWETDQAVVQAKEIAAGSVRLFGGEPVALDLRPDPPLYPWSDYERGRVKCEAEDIKFIWEPARFNWAVQLLRAYQFTQNEEYPAAFWKQVETFLANNPPYLGPNWTSGQEAAIRLISWSFVIKGFAASPGSTPQRMQTLARSIAAHAARIPPTLIYARSQNNNHLLSEAAGLYTAGLLIPRHPRAKTWRRTGWTWFNRALLQQLEPDGAYIQQSVNYHRLMLQLALWVNTLAKRSGETWPPASLERLRAASEWLRQRVDPGTGIAGNFGHNDGAYLLPLGEFSDFRPTVQAAGIAFAGRPALAPGPWDELSERLGLRIAFQPEDQMRGEGPPSTGETYHDSCGAILRNAQSWVGLRAGHFSHRPGHSDQLHVDIRWHGQAVTLDPGTFRYSAVAPWENGLAGSFVHNSVTIDGKEPMTRAGRFLWLDWDQAEIVTCIPSLMVGDRNGYRKLGVRHRRSVRFVENGFWNITDDFTPAARNSRSHLYTLHWLFPDWPFQLQGNQLTLTSPHGNVQVSVACSAPDQPELQLQLIRMGGLLFGKGDFPEVLGWWSPTYNRKLPALSLRASFSGHFPARLTTFVALDSPSIKR